MALITDVAPVALRMGFDMWDLERELGVYKRDGW